MAIQDTLTAVPPPLRLDEDGVVRVAQTRITLESVLQLYIDGASPEAVVEAFDTLDLADVHAIISYYLHHRTEVNEYLADVKQQEEELRRQIQSKPGYREWRTRLIRRSGQRGA